MNKISKIINENSFSCQNIGQISIWMSLIVSKCSTYDVKISLPTTVVEKTNRPSPVFHTKVTFLRGILETKTSKNCLVLLRINQNAQEEHNL